MRRSRASSLLQGARRIAVFRALQMGDMLCAVPALRALRTASPQARISLIGLPWAQDFARRFTPYIDDFLVFPGHESLPEQPPPAPGAYDTFLSTVRERCFDIALQMQGDGSRSNPLLAQFGAKRVVGFVPSGAPQAAALDGGFPYPAHGPEIRRLLTLCRGLGAPAVSEALEFPLDAADVDELDEHGLGALLNDRDYVCVHPGARDAAKRWPPERFARIADALHARYGLRPVLTGSASERGLTGAVAGAMRSPPIDAAGAYSIGALAALIRRARLLVCNDTGVSHLAAALRVPSVVIFISTDLERWAPLDRDLHRCVIDSDSSRDDMVFAQCAALIERERQLPAQTVFPA